MDIAYLLKSSLPSRQDVVRGICDTMRISIMKGAITPGTQLPPEIELARSLGISRNTLREALNILQQEGTIRREHGVGTFVTDNLLLPNRLDLNLGATEIIRSLGMKPGDRDIRIERLLADGECADDLEVPLGTELVKISRVRLADGKPVIYSLDTLPVQVIHQDRTEIPLETLKELLLEELSIYKILETHLGINIGYGIAILQPHRAEAVVANALHVDEDSLVMVLRQTDYDVAGNPILLSYEYHRSDVCRFTLFRKR
jgi:GntR family transcriptional regulator